MKKLTMIVVALVLAAPAMALPPCTDCFNCFFRRGDANGDGVVNMSDVTLIAQWLCCGGTEPCSYDAADVNDDGQIDIIDVTALANYVTQSGTPPAAPFPGLGLDETADGLDTFCSPGDITDEQIVLNPWSDLVDATWPTFCAGNEDPYDEWDHKNSNTAPATEGMIALFNVWNDDECDHDETCNRSTITFRDIEDVGEEQYYAGHVWATRGEVTAEVHVDVGVGFLALCGGLSCTGPLKTGSRFALEMNGLDFIFVNPAGGQMFIPTIDQWMLEHIVTYDEDEGFFEVTGIPGCTYKVSGNGMIDPAGHEFWTLATSQPPFLDLGALHNGDCWRLAGVRMDFQAIFEPINGDMQRVESMSVAVSLPYLEYSFLDE